MSFSTLGKKEREKILLKVKRQRVKSTCDLREDNRDIPLGKTLKSLYDELNKELFEGLLPSNIQVVYNNRLRRTLGKAYYRIDSGGILVPTKIELRTKHRWTDRFKRKVLTHEMCHVWAYEFHNEEGHGKMFWQKMKELGYPKFHDWEDSKLYERDIYC